MTNEHIISNYLKPLNIKVKKHNHKMIQVSCPICNEGNSPYKARGFILGNDDSRGYNCFNCGESMSFYNFLKEQNETLAKQFYKETRLNRFKPELDSNVDEVFGKGNLNKALDELYKPYNPYNLIYKEFNCMYFTTTKDNEQITIELEIEDLNEDCISYLQGRGFKEDDYKEFKYCPSRNDIVIPFFLDRSKNLIYGLQSRNLVNKVFHNNFFDNPKITNLEMLMKLPKGSDLYGVESEFDRLSTGIYNSVAVLGSTISDNIIDLIKEYNFIVCNDADIPGDTKAMNLAKEGYNVLIHQDAMYQFKDFNQLLQLGQSKENIEKYIKDNIQSNKRAYLMLRRKM